MTRQEKLAAFRQLTKLPNVQVASELVSAKARLLIDHPHSYREWQIVGRSSIPGFFHLRSSFRTSSPDQAPSHSTIHLCLHETEFERIP
jgi:hypothetical protein